jgi:hypothetical protein
MKKNFNYGFWEKEYYDYMIVILEFETTHFFLWTSRNKQNKKTVKLNIRTILDTERYWHIRKFTLSSKKCAWKILGSKTHSLHLNSVAEETLNWSIGQWTAKLAGVKRRGDTDSPILPAYIPLYTYVVYTAKTLQGLSISLKPYTDTKFLSVMFPHHPSQTGSSTTVPRGCFPYIMLIVLLTVTVSIHFSLIPPICTMSMSLMLTECVINESS